MKRNVSRPPILAETLIAAVAPQSDYESVTGDLHEEYLRFALVGGVKTANRWYWSQALLSIAPLLSYSRSNRSALRSVGVALIALGVLAGMLFLLALLEALFPTPFESLGRGPVWVWFSVEWIYAGVIGAILALVIRTDGPRVAFCTALFLVLCFAIPALAGNPHSQAPFPGWILLCGVIPAMCIGAGLYQAIRRKMDSAN